MTGVAILIGTLVLVTFGWILYGRWFNHLGLFCGIWGIALYLYQLALIKYYPMEAEACIILTAGAAAFILGSVAHWAWYKVTRRRQENGLTLELQSRVDISVISTQVTRVLWIINLVSFAAVLQHWYVAIKLVGGIPQVVLLSNILYSYRVQLGFPGAVPYLKSLALLGALFGGVLTVLNGRLKLVAVAPIIIIFLDGLATAGRSDLIQSGVFFLSGLFLTRAHLLSHAVRTPKRSRLPLVLSLVVLLAFVLTGMEMIRLNRGSTQALLRGSSRTVIRGATSTLYKADNMLFLSPSLYLYLTNNFAVLNVYLKHQDERTPWGGNTLGPIYHLLEKVGFDTKMSIYEKFYRTPVRVNTGTYLKELHADFGPLGVLVYPYVLGLVASIVWFRLNRGFSFATLSIMGCLLDVIAMSLFINTLRGGDLYIVCTVGVLLGRYLDKRIGSQTHPGEVPA